MLEVSNLEIEYPDFRLTADFVVQKGSRTALLGPSGAGKSTLLAAISGFLSPSAGRIVFDGKDITDEAPGARGISHVFQDQNLFPHMSAAQNVGLALSTGLRLDADKLARIDEALARVGLAGLGNRKPAELSGGQQARVTLARVLLQRGKLLLLDEPFAALGPALGQEMLALVGDLCDETGAALLMVTHDPAAAETLCPDTIVVAQGQAGAPASTKQVLQDPPPALADYLGKGPGQ